MKITLLIPVLNEIEGMKVIMPRIDRQWVDQILFVDGHSTDGTYEYALKMGYEAIIQKKKGIRHAYIEAMPYIKGDIVITFSPDGNCIPEIIPALIDKIKEGYDMAIVSRYLDDAKSEDDDAVTAFGNRLFTKTINLLHGGRYTDSMGIFRAWRKEIFTSLGLDREESYFPEKLFCTVMGVEPLLSVRCARRKLRVAEIPGSEPKRVGERKLQVFRWGAAYMVQIIWEAFKRKTPDKPE